MTQRALELLSNTAVAGALLYSSSQKERKKMFRKCVLLSVVMVMILSLFACGGGAPVAEEEEQEEAVAEAPGDGYQIAEANELRTELSTLMSTVVVTNVEVADYCDTFWEAWRDGTGEEMLQLAEDHPEMVTRVAEAKAELNYVPTIIDNARELNIPAWYRDYFSKKEQAAGYLATALKQAEGFLTGVEPMVENMSDFISVGEGIIDFWEKVMPEIGSLIDEENYSQARQRVATTADSADDMQSLLVRAHGQAGVPVLTWFGDRCGALEEVLVLVIDWLEAKETGNVAQVEQVRSAILTFVEGELEILESIPWDESNIWFERNFGSYVDQIRGSLAQVASVNAEAELTYEAHWVPGEGSPILDIGMTAVTDDVREQVLVKTKEYNYWEEGDIVAGHPGIDIVGAHTREDGDNIVFWMELVGPIMDDDEMNYSFTVFAGTWEEHILDVYYCNGEAEYQLADGNWERIPCEYYKSDTTLMILVPRDVVDTPAGWMVSVAAYEYLDIVWDEAWMNILSGEFYQDTLLLKVEE